MGGATSVYNENNFLEVPLDLPFIAYTLKLLTSQYSKYTTMLSKFSFPKKGNKNKSNFPLVNLCNGGTKDFVELWKIIHLSNI